MKVQLFTIALAALTLYSCGSTQNTNTMENQNATSNNEISGSYWKLETLEGKSISDLQDNDKEIGFTLNDKENRITGFSGCNNFFGTYTLEDGNRINFSALGATRMACPDSAFNESEFLEVFNLADNFTINDDMLQLNVGKRAPLAIFKRVVNDEPIVEKYWKLKTLEGKPVEMAKNQEKEIYFMLKSEDNRVTGFAGCNTILGSYTLEKGNRIRFKNMGSTMMICPDVAVEDSEFLKIFQLADNYTINGDELSLNVGRRAPLAVFEAVYFN
ncbi:META domain-containing protein [Aequorivita capsosiphonis]|uniref:META domain-containing protein n=1 Tax=Aequorivita capsosiphonis TaxID=487317 RepID=UPI00041F64AC|nr:META domain-containing protein [Aequorivita capsosiphonis]